MRLFSQSHIIQKIWKLILSGPGAFLTDCDVSAWEIFSSVISVYAIPALMRGSGPMLCGGFGNADLHTRASFSFIDVAIFPLGSRSVRVVLNWSGFVYLRAVQHRFWSRVWADCVEFSFFSCRKFCQLSLFAFRMMQ